MLDDQLLRFKCIPVTGSKELNAVLAVTGGVTNDSAALKKKAVCFAMVIKGIERSQGGLLDDNFPSIVTGQVGQKHQHEPKEVPSVLVYSQRSYYVHRFLGGDMVADLPPNPDKMLWANLKMNTCAVQALTTRPLSDKTSTSLLTQGLSCL
jgi:magnesium-transporting ATPase (P-type)